MNQFPPEVTCNCGNCGWQFGGMLQQAMSLYNCQNCGANSLFLMAPVAQHLGIWSSAGEPLVVLQQRVREQHPPPPPHVPQQVQHAPAPPSIPQQHQVAPTMPQRGQSPVNRGFGPKPMGPPKRRPIPAPAQKSATGLYVGLGVGGFVLVAVVVALIAASGKPKVPQEDVAEATFAPDSSSSTNNSNSSPDNARPDGDLRALKKFKADLDRSIQELEASLKDMKRAKDTLAGVANSDVTRLKTELTDLDSEVDGHQDRLSRAETKLDDARKIFKEVDTEIKTLRAQQDPLLAFVGTYTGLSEAQSELDDLVLDREEKQVIEHESLKEVKASQNTILTLEIQIADAETNGERLVAELALADEERILEERFQDYYSARDDVIDTQNAIVRKELEIENLIDEVNSQYKKLDRTDAKTKKLLDSVKKYKTTLIDVGRKKVALKKCRTEIDKIFKSTDNPYSQFAKYKSEWVKARKAYRAAGKQASLAEENYKRHGGAVAKSRIKPAQDAERAAKLVEKTAKAKMREAENMVKDHDKYEEKLVENAASAVKELEASVVLAKDSQAKLAKAIKLAKDQAGPGEESRLRTIEGMEIKLTTAAHIRDDALDMAESIEREIAKSKRSKRAAERGLESAELLASWLDESAAQEQIKSLIKMSKKVGDIESISYLTGERIETAANALAEALYELSIDDVSTPAFRTTNSKPVENWTTSVGKATTSAYEIQNIGRVLVQNLTE